MPPPLILESVAANVESTLAFTLSVKLVDIVGNLRGSAGRGGSDPRDATLFLCVGILFLSAAPSLLSQSPGSDDANKGRKRREDGLLGAAMRVGRDMASLASEVLVLAFSRLVMQQASTSSIPLKFWMWSIHSIDYHY